MEPIGFILIGGLALAVWGATKIGADHSREVCEEANLSMGERIRRAKEEWDAMSEEEKEEICCVNFDDSDEHYSYNYDVGPGNVF